VHAVVALCVAAVCFAGSAFLYRRRDGILRFMTNFRGFTPTPPGPRRRYVRGTAGRTDMLSPVVGLMLLAMIFFMYGVSALR
jgi:hypothetical protein